MSTWILIIWMISTWDVRSVAMTSAEFTSKEKCVEAGNIINSNSEVSYGMGWKVIFVCVEK